MSKTSSTASAPKGCTNLKLRQLTRRIGRLYDEQLASVGLKTTQYSLLSHVVKLSPVRSIDLAQALQLQPSSLSRNLRPLMNEGWLVIEPGEDARTHAVVATPAGVAKRQEAQRRWKAAQLQINALLGEDAVAALHAQLDAAMQRLDEAAIAHSEADEA